MIRDLVGADGADKVIETTGVKSLIELAYELTAKKGRCILVGVPREKVEIYTLPLHFDKVLKARKAANAIGRDIGAWFASTAKPGALIMTGIGDP